MSPVTHEAEVADGARPTAEQLVVALGAEVRRYDAHIDVQREEIEVLRRQNNDLRERMKTDEERGIRDRKVFLARECAPRDEFIQRAVSRLTFFAELLRMLGQNFDAPVWAEHLREVEALIEQAPPPLAAEEN
jgi:hypothetical protein